jgi:hypothetical protein
MAVLNKKKVKMLPWMPKGADISIIEDCWNEAKE